MDDPGATPEAMVRAMAGVKERREWARRASMEECLAAGVCDCGEWLDGHEPFPPPRVRVSRTPGPTHVFRRAIMGAP